MKYFIILTTLIVFIVSTQGKHHKKKQTGLFGFFPDLPKLSHHLFKFAFKGSAGDSNEDDHYDEGLECEHYGGKHKNKHRFHKDHKIAYRPYYVDQDYLVQSPGYPYQVSAPAHAQAYYATSHTTLIPIQEQSGYASQLPHNYESLDNNYNLHNLHNVHDVHNVHNLHQSLF